MKFSVLLPTRNRLELLRYAVESVRRQDYSDWEIIVSDNDSEDDVRGYVLGLADARIRYFRTSTFIPVTDNWNNALTQAVGDYFVMLGDDDALLPGYMRKLSQLIEKHRAPEVVYVEATQYAYPNVIPGRASAFVQTGYCEFLKDRAEPFLLPAQEARAAVAQSMAMRLAFSYNMQHSLVSRKAVERLRAKGAFFQSPYPDYYTTNVLLLTSESILVVPEPLVAIGISPKSFGYYYFNARESEGNAFLNNLGDSSVPDALRHSFLPGSALITCWFAAMACIERNFGREYGVHAEVERYRFLQVFALDRRAQPGLLREVWGKLSWMERLRFGFKRLALFLAARLLPAGVAADMMARHGMFPKFDPRQRDVAQRNILELYQAWEAGWRPA